MVEFHTGCCLRFDSYLSKFRGAGKRRSDDTCPNTRSRTHSRFYRCRCARPLSRCSGMTTQPKFSLTG